MVRGNVPIVILTSIILSKKSRNFVTHNAVKFLCGDILVASHTFFYTLDDLQCCLYTYI